MTAKCLQCGFNNREKVKFCEECGHKLESLCPVCGASVPSGCKFCGECGKSIPAASSPSIDYANPHSYTPVFLADKILSSRFSLEGERKLVTVLFADVANYTAMSEKKEPEEMFRIMNGCFQLLIDEINRFEGTVDKFTGDGLMALFGAPLAHEDHARRACYAALAIQKAMEEYGNSLKRESNIDFKMRVGLNSGQVVVGSVGNDLKMDYTAIGDTVNLASRMENNAAPGKVLISENTCRLVKDFFRFNSLGKVPVKGKEEPVPVFELIGATEVVTRIDAAAARGLTRFVGREREVAILREAFNLAKSGSGQVVGIVGEAGVGKSRVLLELTRLLPSEECTFLQGQCLHYGNAIPYVPFLDILRAFFQIREGDREADIKQKMEDRVTRLEPRMKATLPPLEDNLSLKVEDECYLNLDSPARRLKIFEAIRDLLLRESQNKLMIIAVEDLHWIDRTSEELLSYLIGFLANARILLVLLYRPEYTHQWGSKSYYRQISLDQLSLKDSSELVQSILQEGQATPELTELILTRAAGNPLFMEEFTHSLLDNGSIRRQNDRYVLAGKAADIKVPDTIQGIITARMDRLEENLKRTMQVASVIGRDFAFRILQTITEKREELKSYLLNLQGLEFIYEKSLFPELEYIFKHALTQEVAYNSLLLERRKLIHERIGRAIEDLYPDRLAEFYEMLAYHYSRGCVYEKAYRYLKLSAIKAVTRYSMSECVGFGKEALNVLKQMPDTRENRQKNLEMRLLFGTPLWTLGVTREDLPIMEEGARLAEELGDQRSLSDFYSLLGMYHIQLGDHTCGTEYTEKAFQAAEKTGDNTLITTTFFELGIGWIGAGQYYKLAEIAPRILELIEKNHLEKNEAPARYSGTMLYCGILSSYACSLGYLGDFDTGLALVEKASRFAEETGRLYALATAEFYYSRLLLTRGYGKLAVSHIETVTKITEQLKWLNMFWLTPSLMGQAFYLQGDLNRARDYFTRRTDDFPYLLSMKYIGLSEIDLDMGDPDKALMHAEKSLELARKSGEKTQEGRSLLILGRIKGKSGPAEGSKAEETIFQGMKILEELQIKPWQAEGLFYLGELYAGSGDNTKALERLQQALEMFRQMNMSYRTDQVEAVLKSLLPD